MKRRLRTEGLIDLHLKLNLRWPLRLVCYLQAEHDWQPVMAGDAFSKSYRYCKRCGHGWRYRGLKKCWLPWQHHWDRRPSYALGPSMVFDGKVGAHRPYRDIQQCSRCEHTRVIDCATGQVVPHLR